MSRRGASMPNLCVVAMVSFCTAVLITRGFSRGEAARQKGSSSKERELLSELDAIEAECQKETKEMKKKLKECKKEVKKMTQMAEDEQENYEENGEKKETLPYLSIAIPTVPRQGSKYLRDTLKSIEKQVTGTWEGNLVTYVMNMKKGEHDEFTSLKDKYRKARWVVFLDSPEKYEDNPDDPVPQVKPMRRQERPTKRVRRQTLDVARLLEHVSGRSQYTMLYEDDFHLCENGLMAIQYMIEKANRYQEGWAGIRCSFGLAGIMLHNKGEYNDVEQFARYLKKHYARRPPDHLVVEWYAGEIEESKEYFGDRRVMAFRHNIAHHIGEHSSIRETKHWSFPGCFAELIAPQVFPVEAWSPVDCPNDDLWPCTSATGPSKLAWTTDSHDRVQPGTKVYSNT